MGRRYRSLQRALLFWQLAHLVALISMVVALRPGLDFTAAAGVRADYIAQHAWLWRLGWLPWQLSALSDLLVSITLLRWMRARLRPTGVLAARAALMFTVLAMLPEQYAELHLITEFIEEAAAVSTGALAVSTYQQREGWAMVMTGTWGNGGYVLMTLCWILSLRAAVVAQDAVARSTLRPMLSVGIVVCALFSAAGVVVWCGAHSLLGFSLQHAAPLNALAFPLLAVWGVLASVSCGAINEKDQPLSDEPLHRVRPRPPQWLDSVLTARGLRDLLSPLPFWPLRSDVEDVVYLNWLVPAQRIRDWLPAPLQPDLHQERAMVSVLTYRHGHLGPKAIGPLRLLAGSPVQSNWRVQLRSSNAVPGGGIYFFKTLMSSRLYAIAARLLSDGLPAQWSQTAEHSRQADRITTHLHGGWDSAPELHASVRLVEQKRLPNEFSSCFESYHHAVSYITQQTGAVNLAGPERRPIHSRIKIPIVAGDVEPASLESLACDFLSPVIAGCECFSFVVAQVDFEALGESELETEADPSLA